MSSSSGAVVLGPNRGGSKLSLGDFFAPDSSWTEGSFDIADRKGVQGIVTNVRTCTAQEASALELRLADNYRQLTFSAGQSNDSKDSDRELTVAVEANDRQVSAQNIPFNKVQDFTTSVVAVNSLKILFFVNSAKDSYCQGSVNAVIFNITVQ